MSLTVLHLAANRWWTGSADPVIQLASGLRARGHRVLLGVIPGDRFEAKAREAGFDIVPDLDLQARFQPFAFIRDVRRLSKVVAREGVDVIHCHHSHDIEAGLARLGLETVARNHGGGPAMAARTEAAGELDAGSALPVHHRLAAR